MHSPPNVKNGNITFWVSYNAGDFSTSSVPCSNVYDSTSRISFYLRIICIYLVKFDIRWCQESQQHVPHCVIVLSVNVLVSKYMSWTQYCQFTTWRARGFCVGVKSADWAIQRKCHTACWQQCHSWSSDVQRSSIRIHKSEGSENIRTFSERDWKYRRKNSCSQ